MKNLKAGIYWSVAALPASARRPFGGYVKRARVAIGDFNMEAAEALVEELNVAGAETTAWYFDQSEETTINTLVESVVGHFGRLDGLFANVADLKRCW